MDGGDRIEITLLGSIGDIPAADWDACAGDGGSPPLDPFTTHRFLEALETSGSVGPGTGWTPRHLVARSGGTAIAVMPLYAKGHSQGEYIFDHNWAHAWENAGGRYYPKLQSAVPFTPATGRRFLVRPGFEAEGRAALLQGALTVADRARVSGLHVTFCTEDERAWGEAAGLLARTTQQFHWLNRGYPDFDAFLADLSSRKRKAIRRERERAQAFGGEIVALTGDAIEPGHWDAFWRFYQDTGGRKWGRPYLTRAFFDRVQATMRDDVLLAPRPPPRPPGRRRPQLHRPRHPLRPLLGLHRGPPLPALRALLLPGDRLGHRPRPRPRRGRRPGRAQARPRLPAGRDPLAALARRPRLRPRRRRLPARRGPRRRRGDRGPDQPRPVPPLPGRRAGVSRHPSLPRGKRRLDRLFRAMPCPKRHACPDRAALSRRPPSSARSPAPRCPARPR